jgi:hypothetical protein
MMSEKINIYCNKQDEYYYASHKINKKDKRIESDISVEYAFNYCESKNFNMKLSDVTKTVRHLPAGHSSGDHEIWRKEHHLLSRKGKLNAI